MADKFDFKKEYPDLYLPKAAPMIVDVPSMVFLYVDGLGAPEGQDYQGAVSVLYSLTYTIKFSGKAGQAPAGFFEYTPPPLEGLWVDIPTNDPQDRASWRFTSLIRQPEFVTEEVLAWAKRAAATKKPELDYSRAKLATWQEGLCVQALHKGPYATEPETLDKMQKYTTNQGYTSDFSANTAGLFRRHHELYLNDPNKTKPENLKTVMRHPVRKI